MFDLEINIRSWSDHLRARGNFKETDIIELESHLNDEIEDLIGTGLAEDSYKRKKAWQCKSDIQ